MNIQQHSLGMDAPSRGLYAPSLGSVDAATIVPARSIKVITAMVYMVVGAVGLLFVTCSFFPQSWLERIKISRDFLEPLTIAGWYVLIPYTILVVHIAVTKFQRTRGLGGGDGGEDVELSMSAITPSRARTASGWSRRRIWVIVLFTTLILCYAFECIITDEFLFVTLQPGLVVRIVLLSSDIVIGAMFLSYLSIPGTSVQSRSSLIVHYVQIVTPYLYTLRQTMKLYFLPADAAITNQFTVAVLLTIPILHLPGRIALVSQGWSLARSFTHQMDASFAHNLHVMDAVDLLLFKCTHTAVLPPAVYKLLLFFVVSIYFTANILYAALFSKSHRRGGAMHHGGNVGGALSQMLVPRADIPNSWEVGTAGAGSGGSGSAFGVGLFGFYSNLIMAQSEDSSSSSATLDAMRSHPPPAPLTTETFLRSTGMSRESTGTGYLHNRGTMEEEVYNEDMLHYLLWLAFYADLPLAIVRIMLYASQNLTLSLFLAKNVYILFIIPTLMARHSKLLARLHRTHRSSRENTRNPPPSTTLHASGEGPSPTNYDAWSLTSSTSQPGAPFHNLNALLFLQASDTSNSSSDQEDEVGASSSE